MVEVTALGQPPIKFAAPDVAPGDVVAVQRVLESGWLTTGEECERFEVELAEYLGGGEVVALSSCTAALEIAAAYSGLAEGHRIGIPTWTFVSSALAVMRNGALPVLLDIDAATLNLDVGALDRALEEQSLDAIVLVHMAGTPVAREVHERCAEAGLVVIEDAAHALGAEDFRGRIGSAARATCFSFYATKNLSSGEGGALATTDPDLANFARSYRLHGLSHDALARYRPGAPSEYDLVAGGIKANFPDMLAAIARSQLERFEAMQERRAALSDEYRSLLADVPRVSPVPGTAVPGSANHLMMVALDEGVDRDEVRRKLSEDGIGTSVHFRPLHTFAWLERRSIVAPGGLRCADSLRTRILSLPLHTRMDAGDVARVCERLAHHVAGGR